MLDLDLAVAYPFVEFVVGVLVLDVGVDVVFQFLVVKGDYWFERESKNIVVNNFLTNLRLQMAYLIYQVLSKRLL